MHNFSFEKLSVYMESRKLVAMVYEIINSLPNSEKFALTGQLQRAIISVPSNIAEGSGRRSIKEKIHFLEISFGSLMEAYCQLQIALDLGYISQEKFNEVKPQYFLVSRLLSGLVNSFQDKVQTSL